nr:zf-TFIIB domain-containing protein [Halorientalis brevis]
MTTEFDLPCVDCGQELVRQQVTRGGTSVTVAQCPNCGGQYYPKATLEQL